MGQQELCKRVMQQSCDLQYHQYSTGIITQSCDLQYHQYWHHDIVMWPPVLAPWQSCDLQYWHHDSHVTSSTTSTGIMTQSCDLHYHQYWHHDTIMWPPVPPILVHDTGCGQHSQYPRVAYTITLCKLTLLDEIRTVCNLFLFFFLQKKLSINFTHQST